MTERKENTLLKATMTYGLYMGISFSLVVLFFSFAGHPHTPGDKSGLVNTIITAFAMLYFGKQYRNQNPEIEMLYSQALGFTVLLSVFSAIIFGFFSYWYYMVIEPNALYEYIKQAELAFEQFPALAIGSSEALKMITPGVMAFAVGFNQTFLGIFIGLIVSIFIKKPTNSNLE